MGVGLIGDAPAGAVLAQALAGAGHALIGRSAPPEDRAESVDALLPGVPVWDVADIVSRSEFVLLAAEGEALDTLVDMFEREGLSQPGQLVAHLALDRGLRVLDPLQRRGIIPLRLYPMMPFTGTSIDVARLRGAYCAVSAPNPVLAIAQALAIEVGMEPVVLDDDQHELFSEAVTQVTGASLDFVHTAIDSLNRAGIDHAAPALAALLRATIDRVVREQTSEGDLLGEAAARLLEEGGIDGD